MGSRTAKTTLRFGSGDYLFYRTDGRQVNDTRINVDVEITAPGLLLPRYSLSLLIGMGPNYKSRKVESTCGYCSLNKSCVYRNRSEPNPP